MSEDFKIVSDESKIKSLEALEEKMDNIQLALEKLSKGSLRDADLNNDGKVSRGEQKIYDLFEKVTEKMQKNHIWSQVIMVVFLLLSALFSIFGIQV